MEIGKQIGPEIGICPDFQFLGCFSLISYFGTYLFSYFHSGTYSGPIRFPILARRSETYFLASRLDRNSSQLPADYTLPHSLADSQSSS